MSITVITARAARTAPAADRWVYLGKNTQLRQHLAQRFGREREQRLGDRVDRMAREIREQLREWSARANERHRHELKWWATRIASPNPYVSDWFLLICLVLVGRDLITEWAARPETTLLVIEDPWAFQTLRRCCNDSGEIRFQGKPRLGLQYVRLAIRGVLARLRLFAHLVFDRLAVARGTQRDGLQEKTVWIFSLAENRIRTSVGFDDPYLAGLGDMLTSHGLVYQRCLGPLLTPELRRRQDWRTAFLPLSGLLRWRDLLWLTVNSRPPQLDLELKLRGLDLEPILARERWHEIGSANLSVNLTYYAAFRQLFSRRQVRKLFYFSEWQPWEKLLCLARDRFAPEVELIGYQHSTIPLFLLSHFPWHSQWSWLPRPDALVANGALSERIFREANYPDGYVRQGGALRYGYFCGNQPRAPGKHQSDERRILVALPIDTYLSRELMELLAGNEALWREQRMRLEVKTHPDCPWESIAPDLPADSWIRPTPRRLEEQANALDAVLYCSTSVGLEAVLLGLPTFAYVAQGVLTLDATLDWFPGHVIRCDNCTLIERLVDWRQNGLPQVIAPPRFEDVFGAIQADVWIKLASGQRDKLLPTPFTNR